jgi:amidase
MNRRTFLSYGPAIAGAVAIPARGEILRLEEEEIGALRRHSAVSLTRSYLARIRSLDRRLGAVIEVNPDALKIAAGLDAERRRGHPRGPLHGIPVLIKDNIDTGDRMLTTAGSLALEGSPAPRDSAVAERLRQAGAVILGKTNLSEWANYRSTHSVSGWSGRGGQTRNPYALDRNPCGSSSGSGAAVSANLCAVAVGTETDGSVVCPSSLCGIVGIKPTLGLIGGAGIIPIAKSQDTAGPMARTVRDAAILLGALADPHAGRAEPDYTKFLDPAGLRGARLGVARKFFGFNPAVDRIMEDAIAGMKKQGAEIVDPADPPSNWNFEDAEGLVLSYEFKTGINHYLESRGSTARFHSLTELIAFNQREHKREMPYFGQEIFERAEGRGPLTEPKYLDAVERSHRLSQAEGIDAAIAKYKLDALIGPTAGPAWTIDWVNGDNDSGGCSTPAAMAGYPHITVPAGFIFGLPVGISFFGAAWSEPALLKFAYAFEQSTRIRKAPRMLSTVSFEA